MLGSEQPPAPSAALLRLTQTLAALRLLPDGAAAPHISSRELADALWLAVQMGDAPVTSGWSRYDSLLPADDGATARDASSDDEPRGDACPEGEMPDPAAAQQAPQPQAEVFPDTGAHGSGNRPARALRMPGVPRLPDPLGLSRALRALRRCRRVAEDPQVDPEATADLYAANRLSGQHLWQPVWQPRQVLWLDLDLILDTGPSMRLWAPLAADLHGLLRRSGAFGRVALWRLNMGLDGPSLVTADLGAAAVRRHDGQPRGQRLALIVSDAVSPGWYDPRLTELLTGLARTGPIALVQMLPIECWRDTALGLGDEVRLHLHQSADGAPLQLRLAAGARGPTAPKAPSAEPLLPILELTPGGLRLLARCLSGRAGAELLGRRVDAARWSAESPYAGAQAQPSAEERIEAFLSIATPPARKLGGYLASVPYPLTLDIMRLIQASMEPQVTLAHLAEVFTGGLLERHGGGDADPSYRFIGLPSPDAVVDAALTRDVRRAVGPIVRELRHQISPREAATVLRNISEHMRGLGRGGIDWRALLEDPTADGSQQVPQDGLGPNERPLALIGVDVLRGFGGTFVARARVLDEALATLVNDQLAGHERSDTTTVGGIGPNHWEDKPAVSLTESPPTQENRALFAENAHHTQYCVRVLDQAGQQAGTGILVGPAQILTCTHVVVAAQGRPDADTAEPGQGISVELPFLAAPVGGPLLAMPQRCKPVMPQPQVGDLADIALLRLEDPSRLPAGAAPAALRVLSQPFNREAAAFGFQRWDGDTVRLSLLATNTSGAVQIEQRPGYPEVGPGFSGAAVREVEDWSVIGMLVRRDRPDPRGPKARTAYMIPAAQLLRVLDEAGVAYPSKEPQASAPSDTPPQPPDERRLWTETVRLVTDCLRAKDPQLLCDEAFRHLPSDPSARLRTDGAPSELATAWVRELWDAKCMDRRSPLNRLLTVAYEGRPVPILKGFPFEQLLSWLDDGCVEDNIAEEIVWLIDNPGTRHVIDFADGRLRLVAVHVHGGHPIIGLEVRALYDHLPRLDLRVAAISRRNTPVHPTADTVIAADDLVYILVAPKHISSLMSEFGRKKKYKSLMVGGGGKIGARLAYELQKRYRVKVIDRDLDRCKHISERLHYGMVIQGEAEDEELLLEEDIKNTDVFCATTRSDAVNTRSATLAKRLGVRMSIAIVDRPEYVERARSGGVDVVISPQRANIGGAHLLRQGAGVVIEAIAHGHQSSSEIVDRAIEDIRLPEGCNIGAIVYGNESLMAHHDTVIRHGDRVVLFLQDRSKLPDVKRLFRLA